MPAMPFPAYRERYLPAMTLAQIAALPHKARTPVIVAAGAIEQHGPHLPLAVDAFLGQVWLTRIFAALPATVPALAAPPITVGKSNEHIGFPGTLSVSKETLRAQLLALATQLKRWGFRSLLILNTHGGNGAVLAYVGREIAHTLGLRVAAMPCAARPDLAPQEATYGVHAGTYETALLYATAPGLCHPERASRHFPARLDDPGELRPECAAATFAWAAQDLSPNGVMGDATVATQELGERWLDEMAAAYVSGLTAHAAELAREAGD